MHAKVYVLIIILGICDDEISKFFNDFFDGDVVFDYQCSGSGS